VGEHIFRECICGVLGGRTRVLVTHQVSLTLPEADYVVIMGRDGTIVEQGSRAELQGRAADLLERYGVLMEEEGEGKEEEEGVEEGVDVEGKGRAKPGAAHGAGGQERQGKELIKEEEREEGSLKLAVYWAYFVAM
jgi:ABC-type multidrug transport system ATPase subunit